MHSFGERLFSSRSFLTKLYFSPDDYHFFVPVRNTFFCMTCPLTTRNLRMWGEFLGMGVVSKPSGHYVLNLNI